MSLIVVIMGAFIVLIGVVGFVVPSEMKKTGSALIEKDRFFLVPIFRIVVGVLFLLAAESTKAPIFVTVVGVAMIVAGLAIPLLGKARLKALVAWFLLRGDSYIRVQALIAVALGAALIWAGA